MSAKRQIGTGAAVALLALTACGGASHPRAMGAAEASEFEEVVAAAQLSKVAWCPQPDGTAYVALAAPPAETAGAASFYRYLAGRVYQFGPCEVPVARRNELHIFRYPGPAARDAAIHDMSARSSRPTASFAIGDDLDAEIWSPEPSLEGPVGRAAASMHSALGHMAGSRHLDVDPCPPGEPARVAVAGFAFCPAVLTVAAGTEVVWSNADLSPHTVTFDGPDDPFDSGAFGPGASWSHRFDRPGVYQYDCRLHPGMSGTVVVA